MADYPASIWVPPVRGTNMSDAVTQTDILDEQNAEIVAMQTELGLAPSGSDATVRVTLDRLRTAVPAAITTWASPTVGGLTKGNGTEVASYYKVGNVTQVYYRFVFGSTSAVTGDLTITTVEAHVFASVEGSGYFDDATGSRYPINVHSAGTTIALLRPINASATYATVNNVVSATVPFTWTTSDQIVAQFRYLTT